MEAVKNETMTIEEFNVISDAYSPRLLPVSPLACQILLLAETIDDPHENGGSGTCQ
jgi:hypothetical protein